MKDLFKEWLSQNLNWETDTEGWEDTYRQDNSDFIVVDGEEGDYGQICYYDEYNNLLATEMVHGGNYGYIDFTSTANRLFRDKLWGFCHTKTKHLK